MLSPLYIHCRPSYYSSWSILSYYYHNIVHRYTTAVLLHFTIPYHHSRFYCWADNSTLVFLVLSNHSRPRFVGKKFSRKVINSKRKWDSLKFKSSLELQQTQLMPFNSYSFYVLLTPPFSEHGVNLYFYNYRIQYLQESMFSTFSLFFLRKSLKKWDLSITEPLK